MNKRIVQIAIGEIPEHIQQCMLSVQEWAREYSYDYELITECPEKYIGLPLRCVSDHMRAELLQTPYTCWVDWDIRIVKQFELEESSFHQGDWFIYNGNSGSMGENMWAFMQPISATIGKCWYYFRSIQKTNPVPEIPDGLIIHYNESRRMCHGKARN